MEKGKESAIRDHCMDIVNCAVAKSILSSRMQNLSNEELRCVPLVSAQLLATRTGMAKVKLPWSIPEPWNGHLRTAPLLFVGQNPAYCNEEYYLTESSVLSIDGNESAFQFFESRFGSQQDNAPIVEGTKARQKDGKYSSPNRFLTSINGIAKQLLNGNVVPGRDYAVTEAARCKATKAADIHQAVVTCADRYLEKTLELSGAKVVVCLGGLARLAFEQVTITKEVELGTPFKWKDKWIVFVQHPNARKNSKRGALSEEACKNLREHLRST